jgi:hypothetical protein
MPPWRSSSIRNRHAPCGERRTGNEAVAFEALIRGRMLDGAARCRVASTVFLPGLLSSSRSAAAVFRVAVPVTRNEDRDRPPPLTGCPGRLASCRLRRLRVSPLPVKAHDLREVLDVKERSEEHLLGRARSTRAPPGNPPRACARGGFRMFSMCSVRPLQSIRVRGSSRLRGSSRGVVETRGRGDEARFAPRVASRPFERLTGRWTPCPAVISTRLRTPGPRLSSARSRLRACLAAARLSTLLASSSHSEPSHRTGARLASCTSSHGVWRASVGYPPDACPSPLHRHIRRASTPDGRSHLRSRATSPRSCSVPVVSHHLDGFLRATDRRFVAPCSRSWGSPGFGS